MERREEKKKEKKKRTPERPYSVFVFIRNKPCSSTRPENSYPICFFSPANRRFRRLFPMPIPRARESATNVFATSKEYREIGFSRGRAANDSGHFHFCSWPGETGAQCRLSLGNGHVFTRVAPRACTVREMEGNFPRCLCLWLARLKFLMVISGKLWLETVDTYHRNVVYRAVRLSETTRHVRNGVGPYGPTPRYL